MSAIEIAADEVHLWDAPLAVDKDEIERNESHLSRGELLYATRFTDLRAKNQFIVSRAKLRELLGGYAGQSPRELQFGMTRDGKPFLASAKEFEFNLTHSGDIVLYGVAHSRHVGVDVERIKEIPRASRAREAIHVCRGARENRIRINGDERSRFPVVMGKAGRLRKSVWCRGMEGSREPRPCGRRKSIIRGDHARVSLSDHLI